MVVGAKGNMKSIESIMELCGCVSGGGSITMGVVGSIKFIVSLMRLICCDSGMWVVVERAKSNMDSEMWVVSIGGTGAMMYIESSLKPSCCDSGMWVVVDGRALTIVVSMVTLRY